MAEAQGFEPWDPFGVGSFQDCCLKPLGQTSKSLLKGHDAPSIITSLLGYRSIQPGSLQPQRRHLHGIEPCHQHTSEP